MEALRIMLKDWCRGAVVSAAETISSQEGLPSMSRWNLAWLLGVSAVTLLGLSLAYSFTSTPNSIHDKHDNIRLLIDVMDEVQAHYVKPLDKKDMRKWT